MLVRNAPPKPAKGSYLTEARMRRAKRVAAEQREMRQAKRRDGDKCRVPRCAYRSLKLPIDPCHFIHRGMGGNPKGDRTTRETVISLCRMHHGAYDRGDLEIEPLTSDGADKACAFYHRTEAGRMECVGVEQRIGVSVTRRSA